jgi:type IX secretion system PorP/SprF family membrane protein
LKAVPIILFLAQQAITPLRNTLLSVDSKAQPNIATMRQIVFFTFMLLFVQVFVAFGQKEIYISQYLHNQYTVNSAFAGSGEALTLFGSFRKQWAGIEGTPQAQLASANTPLKNDKIALGFELYNQNIGMSRQSGFSASYTYRLRQSQYNWIGLGLNAGGSSIASNWSDVPVYDQDDPLFAINETIFAPSLGVGATWYGPRFFSGLSISNLFYTDVYETGETSLDLGQSQFIATAGYLAHLGAHFDLQPSLLARFNTPYGSIFDVGLTVIWQEMLWAGVTYRSSDEVTTMAAFQPSASLRLAYSIDFSTGDVASYNNGTHEISIRYYLGRKIKTDSPKFF